MSETSSGRDPSPGPEPAVARGRRLLRPLAEIGALGGLLFVTRFVLQGELVPRVDQECHIGGIAVDLLAHGVRFPLMAYAPNEYDNGSFVSGVLTAGAFALLGRSVLALKLVTHAIVTLGAYASLSLLRSALDELGASVHARRSAIAALVIGLALAPRVVTMMSTYAVGNHAEGAAICAILLACFAARAHVRSGPRTAALWMAVGLAVYVNKGALLVLPVLAGAELALSRREPRRLAAAAAGLVAGSLPELWVIAQRHGRGWSVIAEKAGRGSEGFPDGVLGSIVGSADGRAGVLAIWAIALTGGAWLARRRGGLVTRAVLALSVVHLAAMCAMAQGGPDAYALYGHPPIVVLSAVIVAFAADRAAALGGARAGTAAGAALVTAVLLASAPTPASPSLRAIEEMGHDRAGAACSWRFAEGFGREHLHGLAPAGRTREQHEIARCHELSEPAQVESCVGGISREIHWRHQQRVAPEPPAGLTDVERREYAFWYGTHRRGDDRECADFADPALRATCSGAVQLDCLVFGDLYMRLATGRQSGRPRCALPEPPSEGYWSSMRESFLARPEEPGLVVADAEGDGDLRGCAPTFSLCYPERDAP